MTIINDDSDTQTEEVTTTEVETESQTETEESKQEESTDHAAELETAKQEAEDAKELATKAEADAKMWKGRLKKEQTADKQEETKDKPVTQESLIDLEFRLRNESRIDLVREDYDQLLEEGYEGTPVTPPIALELAEKKNKVDNVAERERQSDMSSTSVNNREVKKDEYEPTKEEAADGITKEMKKKFGKDVEEMRKNRGN